MIGEIALLFRNKWPIMFSAWWIAELRMAVCIHCWRGCCSAKFDNTFAAVSWLVVTSWLAIRAECDSPSVIASCRRTVGSGSC